MHIRLISPLFLDASRPEPQLGRKISWDALTDREVKARAIRTGVAAQAVAVPQADRVAVVGLAVDRAVVGRTAPEAAPKATPIAALEITAVGLVMVGTVITTMR